MGVLGVWGGVYVERKGVCGGEEVFVERVCLYVEGGRKVGVKIARF